MSGSTAPREPALSSGILDAVRDRVDAVLEAFLAERRAEIAGMDPAAVVLVDEILRLVRAGGKRIRPALCFWAHRAVGGDEGGPIDRTCAALELLHTFALVHDDVMDRSPERRGVPATHVRFADEAPSGTEPEVFGQAIAVLVGDLAAALAERLLRTCGAPSERLAQALSRFDRMRTAMAAGQFLALAGPRSGPSSPLVAALKTGSYTAEGPVSIGTALAGAAPAVEGPLLVYAGLVGRAFQLRDDLVDGDAPLAAVADVDELVTNAVTALEGAPLQPEGARALAELALLLRLERER